MILVGIDVAKDKHDCFIRDDLGEVFFKAFTISNTMQGFDELFDKILSVCSDFDKIKI